MTGSKAEEKTAFTCECSAQEITLLPCSGGSNCGQIANQVAVQLTEDGIGNIYCLAGIGAHIEGMMESARSSKRLVAIDGCSVACAKNTIEHAGLKVTDWICVTDEDVEKNHQFKLVREEIDLIVQKVKESLARQIQTSV